MPLSLAQVLSQNRMDFHPVVPFIGGVTRIGRIDMTSSNPNISGELLDSIDAFTQYFVDLRKLNNLDYLIGGYAEHRTIYAGSSVFDATEGSKPRRLHLGLDIWCEAGSPVTSPLDGTVHSFGNNDSKGDYGGTIILRHEMQGVVFYSLYGHLSHNSTGSIHEGKRIDKGEIFAQLGAPAENGHWPPHLHFQLIENIGTWKGDYPGVCAIEEKEYWLANSPDPDIILDMNRYCL